MYPCCQDCKIRLGDSRSKRCRKCARNRLPPPSEEIRKKISETMKRKISDGTYTGYTFQHGNRVSLGLKRSEEHKRKISEANRGRIFSPESRKKMSDAKKGLFAGSKNPRWLGGEREYSHQEARRLMGVHDPALHVHHIDGDWRNNSMDNLMVLSNSDHIRLHALQDNRVENAENAKKRKTFEMAGKGV